MGIVPITHERMADVAALVARLQPDPAHHIAYLSVEHESIAAELAGLEPDPVAVGAVLLEGDAVAGALLAEWDSRPPRAWWYGPFVEAPTGRWHRAADELYAACLPRLPSSVTQEEIAADAGHETMAAFATRHGFRAEEGSSVLHLADLPLAGPCGDLELSEASSVADDVRRLHDATFPGTHRDGADLVGKSRMLVVARRNGGLVGYALAEVQPSGESYLDFLAVEPTMRRRGAGRSLVVATSQALAVQGCLSLHLTVRERNEAARALYKDLGFTEERILRPYRKGFTLGPTAET